MTIDQNAVSATVAYIDKRLATIERSPATWGLPESLELQTLLLLEVRSVLLRSSVDANKPFAVRLAYIRFIKAQIKNASAEFLAPQLERLGRIEELPRLLAQFRDEIRAMQRSKTSEGARPLHTVQSGGLSPKLDWQITAMNETRRIGSAPPRMGTVPVGVSP